MKNIIIYLLITLALFATSCDFLDYDERAALDESLVFEGHASKRNFLYSIYESIPRADNYIGGAMLACATDDAEFVDEFSNIQRFNSGNISVSFNPDDQWSPLYAGIRKSNVFLKNATIERLDEYKYNLDEQRDGDQYYPKILKALEYERAEARFLRAYFYFELIKRYGGVPLITDLNQIDYKADDFNIPRNTFEQCRDFIISELNAVIPVLPTVHDTRDGLQGQTGRATKGAAMALKARLMLYAASPLFNASNDVNLWKQAARASYDVIALNLYSLHANYDALFTNHTSPEMIFERRVVNSNDFERANYPIGYDGGNTGTCPSQNLVDAYEMQSTGLPVTNPASGYAQDNPYAGRDPRLYATILHNNSTWFGRPVEIWEGGRDAPPIQNATKTGYYLKKYMNVAVRIGAGQNTTQRHTWYLFRLGEVYLNLAEAMNEAYGPEADPDGVGMTALQAVNLIRDRAKMPRVAAGITKDELRVRLRNERRVELAFENHRFWDVRRWMIGQSTLGADLRGVDVRKVGETGFSYTYKTVENRVFEDRMNLYPIPYSEVMKAKLTQNPGW